MAAPDEPDAAPRVKPAMPRVPVLVADGFMGRDYAQALLEFAVAHVHEFDRAVVTRPGVARERDLASRRSLTFEGEMGELGERFLAKAREARFFAALGVDEPSQLHHQFALSAHRDGDFFRPHSDIVTSENRQFLGYDRLVTLTYYVRAPEARFEGGELLIHPLFGQGEVQEIAPLNDRLVAFPSFAPHEVRPVSQPDAPFGEARFALTCWLGRKLA